MRGVVAGGPPVLVLHASGTNRDDEAAMACERAGGRPEIVHVNELRGGRRRFDDYAMLVVPGGFSYGDALGAGARMALDLWTFFRDQLDPFVASGRPVLGICNGFQVLVKAGVLGAGAGSPSGAGEPAGTGSVDGPVAVVELGSRRVTLTENQRGHFECRWVHLKVEGAASPFLERLTGQIILCPVAHGEGRFVADSEATLDQLEARGQVAFRYVSSEGDPVAGEYPSNPNGSQRDIAGICSPAGNVIGLMPHPEDHILDVQRPFGQPERLGLTLFESLIGSVS